MKNETVTIANDEYEKLLALARFVPVLIAENERLRAENKLLRDKVDLLVRRVFGSSSEKLDANQLLLDLGAGEEPGFDEEPAAGEEAPPAPRKKRAAKREKLLQYAARVWNLTDGDPEVRIDAAIECTRSFFERMEIKTRLADYGIGRDAIPALVAQLERHGLTALGERRDLTPEDARKVYERAA